MHYNRHILHIADKVCYVPLIIYCENIWQPRDKEAQKVSAFYLVFRQISKLLSSLSKWLLEV